MAGVIYCGDNREVMDEFIPTASVDLVYLDPPFNSKRTYNLVYRDAPSDALDEAFKDCWSWEEAAPTFMHFTQASDVPKALRGMLKALHELLVETDADLLAYLAMMAPRLLAIHRSLKLTGSLYLHCDPTAGHYLKLMLDAIFGSDKFETEIIWQRSTGKALSTRRLPNNHDVILVYRRGEASTWNADEMFLPYDEANLDEKTSRKYSQRDPDGRRYRLDNLINPNRDRPNLTYEFLGVKRVWRWTRERMQKAYDEGLVVQTRPGTVPAFKRYLDEQRGRPLGDVWTDIPPLNSQAVERTGYPTQKPLALLERIIRAASKPGDLVLDPFCGCGTTVEAAERLGRRWIGIDIARKAVEVIEQRFERIELDVPIVTWHPADIQSAEALAKRDKHLFEQWALRKVRAARRRKRDRGIDGEAAFRYEGKTCEVLVSVKGGEKLAPAFVRELRGTIEREKADIGVLVSLVAPSKEMRFEASRAGFLPISDNEGPIPRLQLVTVERLFSGLPAIRAPGHNVTEMPKKSVPPTPGAQLDLGLANGLKARARPANSQVPVRGPVSTRPRATKATRASR